MGVKYGVWGLGEGCGKGMVGFAAISGSRVK